MKLHPALLALSLSGLALPAAEALRCAGARQETYSQKGKRLPAASVSAPRIVKKVEPIYPEEARKKGVHGTVHLGVVIAKDGTILEMKVLSGKKLLNQAAMDAVKQWQYTPALLNGEPVEVETTIDVHFELNKKN